MDQPESRMSVGNRIALAAVLVVLAPFACVLLAIFLTAFILRWADCFVRFRGDWDAKLASDWRYSNPG